ncbi:unnamed protein product [Soboliphyme baturini]|uniref:C2H2-type domain-containing protein n=1 Tax=Soboliphyme baturini TaxID=241478 RepID=A0A183I9T3_9BILA|nr:unnamed protein product [Soboliphyme baturini]
MKLHFKDYKQVNRACQIINKCICCWIQNVNAKRGIYRSHISPRSADGFNQTPTADNNEFDTLSGVNQVLTIDGKIMQQSCTETLVNTPLINMMGSEYSMAEFFAEGRRITFEVHYCQLCNLRITTRFDMQEHCEMMHRLHSNSLHDEGGSQDIFLWCELLCCFHSLGQHVDVALEDDQCPTDDQENGSQDSQELPKKRRDVSLWQILKQFWHWCQMFNKN